MRKLNAAPRRLFLREPRVGLVAIVVVHALFVLTDGVYVCGNAFSARPVEQVLNYCGFCHARRTDCKMPARSCPGRGVRAGRAVGPAFRRSRRHPVGRLEQAREGGLDELGVRHAGEH